MDLLNIQSDPFVRSLRDQYGADIVTVMVRNAVENGIVPACGAAFTQNNNGCLFDNPVPSCSAGIQNFRDWAYNWVAQNCARLALRLAFPHELAHSLGGEHPPGESTLEVPREDASFQWAYGHSSPVNTSVLGISNALAHVLYFSNPDTILSGFPLGEDDMQDVGRVVEIYGPEMSLFRTSIADNIFSDSFESP